MKNEEQFEKRKIHAEQKIKLLLNNPKFLNEVKSLRTKWQIPSDGFSDDRGLLDWESWLFEVDDKYHKEEWPKVLEKLEKLQEERKIAEYEKEKLTASELNPRNQFLSDIKNLANRFNIFTDSWVTFVVRSFLLTNKIMPPPVLNLSYRPDFKKKQIQIIINEYTSLNDIKSIWHDIKALQSKLNPKKKKLQPSRNLDRDLEIFNLRNKGLSGKDIMDQGKTDDYIKALNLANRFKKKLDTN